jgi:phosphoserine phosphatase
MKTTDFSAENRERLDRFLAGPHPAGAVATLDLDGTLVHHDTGEAVFQAMAATGRFDIPALLASPGVWKPFEDTPEVESPREALLAYERDPGGLRALETAMIRAYRLLIRCAGKEVAYAWVTFLFAGMTVDEIRALSREVIEAELRRPLGCRRLPGGACDDRPILVHGGLRPYEPMTRLVRELRDAGIDVWIVTASNRWTAEIYAERVLELPAERVLGVTPRTEGGRIVAEPDPSVPLTFGDGKVEAIRRIIGRAPVFAAGDSLSQCEMLCFATGLRLVIDKGDERLGDRIAGYRAAGQANWLVQPRFIDPPA